MKVAYIFSTQGHTVSYKLGKMILPQLEEDAHGVEAGTELRNAGLAMLRILQTAFVTSFRDRFSFGALLTFVITVANVPIFNIGAPFWGLVFGFGLSWLLERKDFQVRQPGA